MMFLMAQKVTANDKLTVKMSKVAQKTYTLNTLKRDFKPQIVKVFEPHENTSISFEAISLSDLLKTNFGKQWQKKDEVIFTCLDGYQASIPLDSFSDGEPYLAFRRVDQKKFTINNKLQNESNVQVGPFYLIWKGQDKDSKWGASRWPYQVVSIEMINFKTKFSKLFPGSNPDQKTKKGFKLFRKHCLNCHTINGQGGIKGIELNYPMNVTEYIKEPYLHQWIKSPRSMRFSSTMSDFTGTKDDIDAIIHYLKAMVDHKITPAN